MKPEERMPSSSYSLRDRLRADDPVRSLTTTEEEEILTRLARRVSALEPRHAARRRRWTDWIPVAAATLLLVALGWRWATPRPAPSADVPVSETFTQSSGDEPSSGETGRVRQLQFETPGGTRIIWILDPESTL